MSLKNYELKQLAEMTKALDWYRPGGYTHTVLTEKIEALEKKLRQGAGKRDLASDVDSPRRIFQ